MQLNQKEDLYLQMSQSPELKKKNSKRVYITPHLSILIMYVVSLQKRDCYLGSLAFTIRLCTLQRCAY